MAAIPPRKRPGPQPKGKRRQFTVRVPVEQFDVYQLEADRQGMVLADYFAAVLARGHGLPEPAYLHRRHAEAQQQLPLTGTG